MRRLCLLLALGVLAGCSKPPAADQDSPAARRQHASVRVIGNRYVTCQDGTRADLDFIADCLRMAVTWLPAGPTESLTAPATGEPYRGGRTRAIVAGGTIAFERGDAPIRFCRRPE